MNRLDWEQLDWPLLARYLGQRCSPEERLRIRSWIDEDPAHKRFMERLQQVWEAAEAPWSAWPDDEAFVSEDWARLAQKMQARQRRQTAPDRAAVRQGLPHRRFRRSFGRMVRLALVLVLLVGAALLVLRYVHRGEEASGAELALREVVTERGERAQVELAEGTRLHLNVESKLRLPERFAADRREVYLEGEAYFEVAKEASRPFIVHTGNAVVKVLGTAFNVRAYGSEEAVEVVVAEGQVALHGEQQQERAVVLSGQQRGQVAKGGQVHVSSGIDTRRYLAWREGRLIFEDAPLSEVAVALERWYDLQVRIAEPEVAQRRLTAEFEEESLSSVLKVIAASLEIQYERQQRVVTFYR